MNNSIITQHEISHDKKAITLYFTPEIPKTQLADYMDKVVEIIDHTNAKFASTHQELPTLHQDRTFNGKHNHEDYLYYHAQIMPYTQNSMLIPHFHIENTQTLDRSTMQHMCDSLKNHNIIDEKYYHHIYNDISLLEGATTPKENYQTRIFDTSTPETRAHLRDYTHDIYCTLRYQNNELSPFHHDIPQGERIKTGRSMRKILVILSMINHQTFF